MQSGNRNDDMKAEIIPDAKLPSIIVSDMDFVLLTPNGSAYNIKRFKYVLSFNACCII